MDVHGGDGLVAARLRQSSTNAWAHLARCSGVESAGSSKVCLTRMRSAVGPDLTRAAFLDLRAAASMTRLLVPGGGLHVAGVPLVFTLAEGVVEGGEGGRAAAQFHG